MSEGRKKLPRHPAPTGSAEAGGVMEILKRNRTGYWTQTRRRALCLRDSIVDFQLQQAAMKSFSNPQKYEEDIEISPALLEALPDEQARYDLVLGHYLSVHISLAKAGELLGMSSHEIRSRLVRLGIPLRIGPITTDEVVNEIESIENWESNI